MTFAKAIIDFGYNKDTWQEYGFMAKQGSELI